MGPVPNFGSKWKEVLGFGDSFSASHKSRSMSISQPRSNFYQITADATACTKNCVTSSIYTKKKLSYPLIPREVIFYHLNNDILVSSCPSTSCLSSEEISLSHSLAGKPLFRITLSADSLNDSGRPNVILHSSTDKASTVVCFAKINYSTPVTEMTLCPPPKKSISANFSTDDITTPLCMSTRNVPHENKPKHAKSKSMCTGPYSFSPSSTCDPYNSYLPRFRTERLFQVANPSRSSFKYVFFYGCEAFEWRRTEPAVHHPNQLRQNSMTERSYESEGMKLIRALTGEVLVAYAQMANTLSLSQSHFSTQDSKTKVNSTTGVMRFSRAECMKAFAEEFDIFVVVSLISIIERERREQRQSLSSF